MQRLNRYHNSSVNPTEQHGFKLRNSLPYSKFVYFLTDVVILSLVNKGLFIAHTWSNAGLCKSMTRKRFVFIPKANPIYTNVYREFKHMVKCKD